MSDIPFQFDHPVPIDFRKLGWFKNHKCLAFVTWAFSRCYPTKRRVSHDGKLIILEPYEFICGRLSCSVETGLSEDEVRTQIDNMIDSGYLVKAPNKTPNRFTIYRWVKSTFTKINPQQNPQQNPNSPPTEAHNTELHSSRCSEPPPPQTPQKSEQEEAEEDFKKIEKTIKTSKEKNLPFSESGIFDVYRQTSGSAVEQAIKTYMKRSTQSVPLRYPDRWLLSESKKVQEYINAKRG